MGIIRDINSLNPVLVNKVDKFITKCSEVGIPVFINETIRLEITQILYAFQGRFDATDLKMNSDLYNELNRLRKKYGLYQLNDKESKRKITWTLESSHFDGNAFDAVPMKMIKGKLILDWNPSIEILNKMGGIGEEVGLVWGGRWPSPDYFHFQLSVDK